MTDTQQEKETSNAVFNEWLEYYYGTMPKPDVTIIRRMRAAFEAGRASAPQPAPARDETIDEVLAEAQRVGIHEPLSLQADPYIRGTIDGQNIVINAIRTLKDVPESNYRNGVIEECAKAIRFEKYSDRGEGLEDADPHSDNHPDYERAMIDEALEYAVSRVLALKTTKE